MSLTPRSSSRDLIAVGDGGLGNKEFLTGPREISVAVDCIQMVAAV